MATLFSVTQTLRFSAGRPALIVGALAALAALPALPATDGKAAAAKLSAAQIVEKHVAARGGLQALRGLQALSLSGKMEAGSADLEERAMKMVRSRKAPSGHMEQRAAAQAAGNKDETGKQVQLPFVMEMKRPDRSRVEIEFAGKTAVQVYDGRHGWKLRPYLNRNDVEPFTAEEMKSESDRATLEGPLVDYAAKGTKVELEKVEPVEGHDAYKLKLTLKSGKVQHIWIDAESFLDVKVEGVPRRMDGRMHDVWIYQRDFRKVDGLMMPFLVETAVDGYPGTHKMMIEKVAVNPKLDDSRFAKPHA
jgi:outer membrane lipoprotein-sorting protein